MVNKDGSLEQGFNNLLTEGKEEQFIRLIRAMLHIADRNHDEVTKAKLLLILCAWLYSKDSKVSDYD